jgi:hypothetical protein
MIRRCLLAWSAILMTLGLGSLFLDLAAPAGASTPPAEVHGSSSPWFCIAIAEINFGYCQYNPF